MLKKSKEKPVRPADKGKKYKKRKRRLKIKGKALVVTLLLFAIFLLIALLTIGMAQVLIIQKDSAKKTVNENRQIMYIVESREVDIDVYLRQYFENKKPKKTMMVTATAYSSTTDQTDGTPYLTAYNTFVRDGIVAANFLPIGTAVRFPKKFEDKFFVVEDRGNENFGLHIDIWMSNREEAKEFGVQYLEMEVF